MRKPLSIPGVGHEIADHDIYASFTRRTLAFALDCLLIGTPCAVLLLLLFPWLLNERVTPWLIHWLPDERVASWLNLFTGVFSLSISIGVVLALYSACFHASPWQATPGKRLMGIAVVNHAGQGIGFVHAFIRQFAFTACGPASLLAGLLLIPFAQHRRGHHDILCDTFVIHRSVLADSPQPVQPQAPTGRVQPLRLPPADTYPGLCPYPA